MPEIISLKRVLRPPTPTTGRRQGTPRTGIVLPLFVVHHATMIALKGKSYRLRERGTACTVTHFSVPDSVRFSVPVDIRATTRRFGWSPRRRRAEPVSCDGLATVIESMGRGTA